jgi:hypothetical protein
MSKLKLVVAAMVFFGVLALGTGLIAEQRTGGGVDQTPVDPTIKALIQARFEVAKQVYETMQPHRPESLEEMVVWSRRWMDEQIRLDPGASKRLAAIRDHLDRTRGLEALADQRHQAARGTLAETLKVRYFRLEAEEMLAELRIINPDLFPPKAVAKP